ncbi:prolyl-tRNA synthetase [Candidatus Peregrinibacteria bacterium]|nr:prolyl-tRNA synthetase [Candidatus Peregrinibacteria bacterium]MBI2523821.1 prolyl-tRNA synthetase [Candidatus Peregrinibacteria bacterium]
MRLSHLFTKTARQAPKDAHSLNADLLVRAGFVQQTMAGVYSYLPLGLRVLRNIEAVVREEMSALGAQELLLSALSSQEVWERSGRWGTFDVLFHVPGAGDQEYALNPTHEEVVVPLVQHFVHSHKDLPFACYQIQTKFRNELRVKSGILRNREFLMKDLYSFHQDDACLDRYYERVQEAYGMVFERLGLAERVYRTFASGGSFSQYSHEYQVLLPQGEDTIYISEAAEARGQRVAINSEIYRKGETACPVTGEKVFREARASEAANIFKLGTKFSVLFKLRYADEKGQSHPVVMGCYGMGISRLMGIITEVFADDEGLRWPLSIAPAAVHIVPLTREIGEQAFREADALYERLKGKGVQALFDDRLDASPGVRLADADLIGVPFRVVVSEKTLEKKKLEVKTRWSGETEWMTEEELIAACNLPLPRPLSRCGRRGGS